MPVTVTVTCPTDNKTASDTVNIQVTRPPARTYTFEDVHFDFDRYSLRPEATRVLDEAVTALREDATLRIADRRAHLQHRHGRIQPGAGRPARERGARLPGQPRRHRRIGCRRSATAKSGRSTTTPRRDAPAQPPRGAHRQSDALDLQRQLIEGGSCV